jgi:hypothetical protein
MGGTSLRVRNPRNSGSFVSSAGGGTRTLTPLREPNFESGKKRCRVLLDLAESAYLRSFSSLPCPMLHSVALPVVSEWCQVASALRWWRARERQVSLQ